MIEKAKITKISEDGKTVQAMGFGEKLYENVVMLFGAGMIERPEVSSGQLILLYKSLGSNSSIFGVPYDVKNQPTLEPGERRFFGLLKKNFLSLKKSGETELAATKLTLTVADVLNIVAKTIAMQAETSISINAPVLNLSDATGLVLNDQAQMKVVVGGVDHPVIIQNAGQTKVNA